MDFPTYLGGFSEKDYFYKQIIDEFRRTQPLELEPYDDWTQLPPAVPAPAEPEPEPEIDNEFDALIEWHALQNIMDGFSGFDGVKIYSPEILRLLIHEKLFIWDTPYRYPTDGSFFIGRLSKSGLAVYLERKTKREVLVEAFPQKFTTEDFDVERARLIELFTIANPNNFKTLTIND